MSERELSTPRPIRSFVKREGKLTKGQKNAIDELWPRFGVDLSDQELDLSQWFARTAETVLDSSPTNGLSLAEMAKLNPEQNYFGIEVHTPGVGSLLVQVKKLELDNVRVSQDDAVPVLAQQIPDSSLDRVQIFFPDPWHKKRHHKRRLIQPEFVSMLCKKLKPEGVIHVATDWENYAEHILQVLADSDELVNTAEDATSQPYVDKPSYRPQTKYETRGQRLGHGVWDLVFKKIS